MPKSSNKRKDKRVYLSSFSCVRALLFVDGGGSAEVSMAPLEMCRLLKAWEESESTKRAPNEQVLAALRLLIQKSRDRTPQIVAEVPIARTRRVILTPDFEDAEAYLKSKLVKKESAGI